jgi:hypothetical protein
MNSRVYLLLDIFEEKLPCTLRALQNNGKITAVDMLEGHPNILVVCEAPDRQELVEMVMPVLDSVGRITRDVRLLMNRENDIAQLCTTRNEASYQKQAVA